jgi:segregation and condensation protein B
MSDLDDTSKIEMPDTGENEDEIESPVDLTPEDESAEDSRFLLSATEALIFSSTEPLTATQHVAALGQAVKGKLEEFVQELNREYERDGRAFEIIAVAGGFQFFTRRDYSGVLRKLFVERARTKLSRAALETLAVVAFRGPVTRAEIDEIRGVDSGGVLRTLLDRRLVAVRGRANILGRPLLYVTTPEFLKHFGLADLSDLPRDSELLREWGQARSIDESVSDQTAIDETLLVAAGEDSQAAEPEESHEHDNGKLPEQPVEEIEPEKDILP